MRTFGLIQYEPEHRVWRIKAEPHVAIRLKRMFASTHQRAGDVVLSDTVETCRDLVWFMERYPLLASEPHRERLNARATEYQERARLVDELLAGRGEVPPFDLALPLREYQKVAAALLLQTGRLLLADDVGVGKTASAIATFCDPRTLPALVVTLAHLPRQWQREVEKFAPNLRTHILGSATPYDLTKGPKGKPCTARHRFRPDPRSAGGASCTSCGLSREDAYHGRRAAALPDVIITSYHKLGGWAETLAPIVRSMVLDEVQELRHAEHGGTPSKRYAAARHLAEVVSYRLGLSATPIFNRGAEFHSVYGILSPGALGEWSEFRQEWCDYGDKPNIKDPKAFGAYLRETGLMLRRTRSDVGRELPPLTKMTHTVDADTKALDRVSAACAELARTILKQGGQAHRAEKLQASEELSNKLRQATGIAKAPYVADFVRLLVESGEKVVLFGWHRAVYDVWLDKLGDKDAGDLHPVLYTGTETAAQKESAKKAFTDGDSKVLIMSLRSGAGLDGLQGFCRTVVFGELDWSPAVHEQGIGRVARDGQPDPVVAYFLVAETGSDPIVADVLGVKLSQIEGVRDPDAELIEKLEVDQDRIKKLAAAWLDQRGLAAPDSTEAA